MTVERIEPNLKGFMESGDNAGHSEYPFSAKSPYNETWIVVEWAGEFIEKEWTWREAETYGTVGDWLDYAVENSDLDPSEINNLMTDLAERGEWRTGGGAAGYMRLRKIDGPEVILGLTASDTHKP